MISQKQLEANRRNSQNSTGPKTAEGKSRSSRNNLRHGLTGQVAIMSGEDRQAHDTFCDELIETFTPATPIERQLAQSIAEDNWRLNRIRAIENNMFALGRADRRGEVHIALADAQTFQEQAAQFALLTMYEQRINRNLHRNMKLLGELQVERKAQREAQMEEAQLLAQLGLANGLSYEPAKDGFVFSNAEINLKVDRGNRLKAARAAALLHERPAAPQVELRHRVGGDRF